MNITPLSWCSAMWQCAIHRPGFVTSSRMSTRLGTATAATSTADALATPTVGAGPHRALGGRSLDAAVAGQAGLGGVDVASGLVVGRPCAQFVGPRPEGGVGVGDVEGGAVVLDPHGGAVPHPARLGRARPFAELVDQV